MPDDVSASACVDVWLHARLASSALPQAPHTGPIFPPSGSISSCFPDRGWCEPFADIRSRICEIPSLGACPFSTPDSVNDGVRDACQCWPLKMSKSTRGLRRPKKKVAGLICSKTEAPICAPQYKKHASGIIGRDQDEVRSLLTGRTYLNGRPAPSIVRVIEYSHFVHSMVCFSYSRRAGCGTRRTMHM